MAHGNSLRALVKYLDNMSDEEIVELNIPTGVPLVYQLNDDLRPLNKMYLGDPEAIRARAAAVANQGKAARNRKGGREAALSTTNYLTTNYELVVIDRLFRFVRADAQRAQKAAIVRGELEGLPSREEPGRRGDLGHCRAIVPVDEADDGFERDAHVVPGFAGPRTARFHLRILSYSGGNRVGQLFREPVHDVIHSCSSYTRRRAGIRGRLPIRTCSGRGGVTGIERQSVSFIGG